MLGDIDYSKHIPIQELWLATPSRVIIGKITQQSGIAFSRFGKRNKLLKHTVLYKLNNISELELSIPYQIEVNHKLVRNPIVDQVRDFYLIKSIHLGIEEWFTITDVKKNMDADKDTLSISCKSLGYELMRRTVRNYSVVSGNLSSLVSTGGTTVDSKGNTVSYNSLLSGSLWTLDPSYDVTFDTIYRTIDISKATVLDSIIQVAKTFNAILLFDTVNRRINFQQLSNIGQDRGLKVSYKNYLKSLENDSKSDLIATRFIPIGKGGLTINSVSPNGQSYIDCFDWFTKGFTGDGSGNVLTSSPYMSDSLCGALADYTALLASKNGQYATLLNNLTTYQSQLTTKNNEMATLVTQLKAIQAQLDIAQTTGASTTSLLSQQTSQNSLIATKQSEINTVNANITSTNTSITSLQATLSTSANFTSAQIQELLPFIFEKEYVDDKISDAQDLYNQGLIKFEAYKTPQIVIRVDMINLFEDILSQYDWSKLVLGDTILIEYDVLGTSVKAKIVEIQFDHQSGNITLSIATISDLLRDEEAVFNMLYQGVSANNTISVNVDNWNSIDTVARNVNAIYNSGIDAAKIAINSGVSNTIVINNRGLTSTTTTDPNSLIRLNNGVLGFSSNGGNTFATAISATGINAAVVTGQLGQFVTLSAAQITTGALAGINMSIGTGNNVFKANASGISLGNSTFASAPFRVDMNGNAVLNSATVSGAINCTSLSINGTSILNGSQISGNFIDSLSANKISAGTITGITITGSTIQTATFGSRIELNSSSNLLVAYGNTSSDFIKINPLVGTGTSPVMYVQTGSNYVSMQTTGSSFYMVGSSGVDINISSPTNINLFGTGYLNSKLIATQEWVLANPVYFV